MHVDPTPWHHHSPEGIILKCFLLQPVNSGEHPCYKTDFLFAEVQGPQSYFRYTILNTQ